MNKICVSPVFILASFMLMAIMSTTFVLAGDEDMNPSPYQRFDPETGYMIPIEEDTPVTSNHGPTQQQDLSQPLSERQYQDSIPSFIWLVGGIVLVGFTLILYQNARERKHITNDSDDTG